MAYCRDTFTLMVTGEAIHASITVPGDFPLDVEAGANYIVAFNYTIGAPPATALFGAVWAVSDAGSAPSTNVDPQAPNQEARPDEVQNGTISGTVPSREPQSGEDPIVYTCTVSIVQIIP